ncbi:MAG: type II toxin-antitoxin system MqsA family antitoxin [Planctomycetes bacterium]|nr:type II toxin-antitoxin system MqsA family antitoxin [Planctomycetia bacterium]MBI3461852.1 type II toxin-antitoxin system MqsA family antitoxin [Planctomycetota bacterium]
MKRKTRPRKVPTRPFPWRCPRCRANQVHLSTIPYEMDVAHDGRLHHVKLRRWTVPQCKACGELMITGESDDQISAALRTKLRLLSPAEIRAGRRKLKLSQKELSKKLGVAEETISRWENGYLIQSRAMDNLLRLFFKLKEVRSVLTGLAQDLPLVGSIDSLASSM